MKTFLYAAQQQGELRLFDVQFARHIAAINGGEIPELLMAAALASNRLSHGDTCLSLASVSDSGLYTNPDLRVVRQKLPKLSHWRKILLEQKVVMKAPLDEERESPPVSDGVDSSGREGSEKNKPVQQGHEKQSPESQSAAEMLTPLILDSSNRLYLARYWMLERSLIRSLSNLINVAPPKFDSAKLKASLDVLFAASQQSDAQPDWQKVAVANAVVSHFCVITGGPGTGKTYTVTALLAALLNQGVDARKIALAAPTGKAAARLTQSIQTELSGLLKKLDLPEVFCEAITLHSLLGSRFGRVQPKHNAEFPLPYDVVIIDEASMIDLPLMARTFEALAPDSRIVLIGDKDQLHSVESGMVLGDICGGRSQAEFSTSHCESLEAFGLHLPACSAPGGQIANHIVYLHKSHRVKDDGGINKLATAVNNGDGAAAIKLLRSDQYPNLTLLSQTPGNLDQLLRELVVPTYKGIAESRSPSVALSKMTETGVLCALKNGRTGALKINALVEKLLLEQQAIEPDQYFYHGRPLMISENNHHQRLYNGDHGVVLHDENGVASVHFAFDSSPGVPKTISPSRLPQHETFFAMTIHKSQGSEFSTAVVVLPEMDSPILSRELLYTAITRARSRVVVLANEVELTTCVERRSVRQSGLREEFWREATGDVVKPNTRRPEKLLKPIQTVLDF